MHDTNYSHAVIWFPLLKIPSNYLSKDKCSLHVHSQLNKLCSYAWSYTQAWFKASRRLLSGASFLCGACWASQRRHQLCVSARVSACTAWACCWKTTADSHLLAVGAYMTGMRQIDANTTIITWLQDHVQVQLLERLLMSVKLSGTYAVPGTMLLQGVAACIFWEECVGPAMSVVKAPVVACGAVEGNTIYAIWCMQA